MICSYSEIASSFFSRRAERYHPQLAARGGGGQAGRALLPLHINGNIERLYRR